MDALADLPPLTPDGAPAMPARTDRRGPRLLLLAATLAAGPILAVGCGDSGGADGPRVVAARPVAAPAYDPAVRQEHDAGVAVLRDGEVAVVSHTFEVPNRSAAPVVPTVLGKSCGCTTVTVAPGPVPPGGSARVTLAFDLAPTGGETRQSASVGLGGAEPVALGLSAIGAPPLAFEGGAAAPLVVRVKPGRVRRIGLTVESHVSDADLGDSGDSGDAGAEVRLTSDSALLRVVDSYPIAETTRPARGGGWVRSRRTHFVCEVVGDGAGGRAWPAAEPAATLTAARGAGRIERRVTLRADPAVAASPPRVLFLNPAAGATRGLRLTADRPFRLLGVDAGPGPVTVAPFDRAAAAVRHDVEVRLDGPGGGGGEPGGAAEATLSFRTDHPDQPVARVRVTVLRTAP